MTTALRNKPTEKLRQDVREGMHDIVGDLLRAAKVAHEMDRIEDMNLQFVQALGNDFDNLESTLRHVHDTMRKVTAAYEMLVTRANEERAAK